MWQNVHDNIYLPAQVGENNSAQFSRKEKYIHLKFRGWTFSGQTNLVKGRTIARSHWCLSGTDVKSQDINQYLKKVKVPIFKRGKERMRTKQLCEIVLMTNGLLLRLQFLSENRKFASSCRFIKLATKGERGWTLELTNSSVVSWSSDSFLQISLKSNLSCTNLIMRMTVEGKHTIPYEFKCVQLRVDFKLICKN